MGKQIEKKKAQTPKKKAGTAFVPSVKGVGRALSNYIAPKDKKDEKISNISLVYGGGSAALFAFSLIHFLSGSLFLGSLLAFLALLLFGYAYYFIRYPGKNG